MIRVEKQHKLTGRRGKSRRSKSMNYEEEKEEEQKQS
jgi:hypothetical protein